MLAADEDDASFVGGDDVASAADEDDATPLPLLPLLTKERCHHVDPETGMVNL